MKQLLTQSILVFLLSFVSYGQTFRFNQYTTEDGISQNFIYSISQDQQGYLWVGTGQGLCKFDGKHFVTFTVKDGLAEEVITCSYVDEKGVQWFGHNEGGISKFDNDKIKALSKPAEIQSKINAISGYGDELYGVSQNEGLFQITQQGIKLIGDFEVEGFQTIQCVNRDNILIGTSLGLVHLIKDNGTWTHQNTLYAGQWVTDLSPTNDEGVYIMALQEGGIVKCRVFENEVQFSTWDQEDIISDYQIQTVIEDKDNNIWLGTYGNGLIKIHGDSTESSELEVTKYNTSTGMASDFVQTVFQDREGNIWIGTFGAGLSTLIDDYFTFYSHDPDRFGNSVTSIHITSNEHWYGVENGLIRISPTIDTGWTFYSQSNGLAKDIITSLYMVDSVMWIGTKSSGVYAYDYRQDKIKKFNWGLGSLQNKINQITGDPYKIFIATEGGLIVYFTETDQINIYDTEHGLAHNAIKSVCKSDDGRIWMGTHSRFLYSFQNNSIEEFEITNAGELEIVSISEGKKDEIWIATAENGVYRKSGDSFSHYGSKNGLKSNYCYAVSPDALGNIWVGHRGGLSKITEDREKIKIYDHTSGIDEQINFRAMFQDPKNYLWIGTDGGAIKYDPQKDIENIVPPVTNLLTITVGEKEYAGNEVIRLPYGNYRVQFNFIGISFKNPEKVMYKYKLNGHDQVFSEYTRETYATYGSLKDGEYEFEVIACTEDGICSEEPAIINLTISKPFWKTIWFFFLVLFALVAAVILIVQIRVRRLEANQQYLEEQLEIKTKEVVEKAEIIQEINKDLTASINYAERIQSAILPEIEDLTTTLPGSFIFYRPRDIVSGDFYFIRQYEKKLIIGCVDCTGHGVPGAFMSMIGSTTLRNIYTLMETSGEWLTPDKVLNQLDDEIQTILHQEYTADIKEDFFRSRDGMDMTLIEVDLDTNEVLLASAKRHSIILQGDEPEFIYGDNRSIGGGDHASIEYSLQKFQMNKGDALFLFTDGYSDQFGGKDGRKMKLSGVKSIISGMKNQPNSSYGKIVQESFDAWQGDREQIDDMLMIGVLF